MSRSRSAAQSSGNPRFLDEGGKPFLVHLARVWMKDEVRTVRLAEFQVGAQRPWVTGKIFFRAKLGRIDEDGHSNAALTARQLPSPVDQFGMPGVQRAHGWHQHDGRSSLA